MFFKTSHKIAKKNATKKITALINITKVLGLSTYVSIREEEGAKDDIGVWFFFFSFSVIQVWIKWRFGICCCQRGTVLISVWWHTLHVIVGLWLWPFSFGRQFMAKSKCHATRQLKILSFSWGAVPISMQKRRNCNSVSFHTKSNFKPGNNYCMN